MKHYTSQTIYQTCPNCRAVLDAATSIDSIATPTPGDVSICFRCATALAYDGELKLRPATRADLDKYTPDQLQLMRDAQAVIAQRIMNEAVKSRINAR